jgi:Tol biopolymer transport system component
MRKKAGLNFGKIAICFTLGLMIFIVQSCNKDQSSADRTASLGISYWDCLPSWSPDGEWFVTPGRGWGMPGNENAFKADDETMFRLPMQGCTPDISPDGKQLAWNLTDFNLNIGKLDFDSIDSSLTDHTVVVACERDRWIYHADWSPDGNYLAFSYGKDGGPGTSRPAPDCNICVCDLRTGKWTLVTTDGKHNKEPDWVPVEINKE